GFAQKQRPLVGARVDQGGQSGQRRGSRLGRAVFCGARPGGCAGHRRPRLCSRRRAGRGIRAGADYQAYRLRFDWGSRLTHGEVCRYIAVRSLALTWMNVPNKLTISRFALTVLFLGFIFSEFPYHETIALLLFSAAGLTVYFDGKIARRDNLIT